MFIFNLIRWIPSKQVMAAFAVIGLASQGFIATATEAKTHEGDSEGEAKILFEDPMTGQEQDWQENWFLDGEEATLTSTPHGLYFSSGTERGNDAHHAVLWTKQEFSGDIRIRFDVIGLDRRGYVNILYIHAQGIGEPPYVEDIYEWRDLRAVPTMSKYFTYMNALHISYNVGRPDRVGYIRARRYPRQPEKGISFGDTSIKPDYDDEGAKILPGKVFTIEVEKRGTKLIYRTLDGETKEVLKECVWDTTKNPENQTPRIVNEGRIGLRQMFTKRNIYRNFKVMRLD